MTPQQMLENMIDEATMQFLRIAKEEEDGDYSDAMLSMERTEANGFVEGLQVAYHVIFDKIYESTVELADDNE